MRRRSAMNAMGRGLRHGSGARSTRLLRRAALPVVLAVAVAAGGCATKKDMKQLRNEVVQMQVRQDSLLQLLREQNRQLMDTMRTSTELVMRVRGDLGFQLQQMEQQLIQIQELGGQSQRRLAELRQQWETRSQDFSAVRPPAAGEPGTGEVDAEQLYSIGTQKLEEGAAATARSAFQQIVNGHTTHLRAPDAQFQIAETYVAEQNLERALVEFERVIELFPGSPRAPQALYRAGVVSEERGNLSKAREYFNRVQRGFPTSEEARLAERKLNSLKGR